MKQKFSLYALFAIGLTGIILVFPKQCLSLSFNGLNLWFTKMIPALFPFMVLSGIIIRMNLISPCVNILKPILGKLFRVDAPCIYGMVLGFLCGFPMGAHTAAELYENKIISKREASFLLAFCNNIGPVYFLSFVVPSLELSSVGINLFGMYGLPFLYGLLLRYTVYSGNLSCETKENGSQTNSCSLAAALDQSIGSALLNITRLGGYMIIFNLLFILPMLFTRLLTLPGPLKTALIGGAGCLLEITGGISLIGDSSPLFVLCVLPFGGLSCIAQTGSMIRNTDLSLTEYVMHKMILTAITVLFYLLAANQFFLP
ncbi:MAG: nucleoside recognition domain-containing protein [Bacillota bacterium]|nr:nucleoside recognition domain-containing protein [Bacillota bacterium]